MKKIKGYSSVLILIFVFIIVITLSLLVYVLDTNNLVLKNNLDMEQSKYISESYLNLILSNPEKYFNNISMYNEESMISYKLFEDKLFPGLEHKAFYKIYETSDEANLIDNKYDNKVPIYKVIVLTEYKGIENKTSALTNKYNPIFFNEFNLINNSRFKTEDSNNYDLYLERFKNNILYNSNKIFINEERVLKNDEFIKALNYYNVFNDRLNSGRVYLSEDYVISSDKNVTIQGVLFLDSCNLTLNNNLIVEGILISNGATLDLNGHEIGVIGKVVELSELGNLSNIKFYNFKNTKLIDSKVKEHIDKISAAKDYDVIYIKRNDT